MNKIKYLLIIIMAALIYSCAEDDFDNPPAPQNFDNEGPVLIDTIDNQNAILLKQNESMTWDTLTWNPAVLFEGQGLVTHYAIQMDEQGNNFASLFEIESSTTTDTSIVITVGNLNAKLLENGFSPLDTIDLELRVKAFVHPDLDSVYSDVYPFTVTTYKDIAVPDELYIFGDATAVGWGADTSLAMLKDDGKFIKYAYLENDKKFRFLKAQNTDDNTYNAGSLITLSDNVEKAGDEEHNFLFTGSTGWYRIEADYLMSSLNITEHVAGAETYTYDYPAIYLVGDYNSTDGVWDAVNAPAFTRVEEGVYTIEKPLKDGAMFKFIGQQDWGDLEWANIQESGNSGIIGPKNVNGDISFDGADKTWEIKVDLKQGIYTFTEIPTLPTELYMIGNSVGGWTWETDAVDMIPVEGNPHLFWRIVYIESGITDPGFKFCEEKAWGKDFGVDAAAGATDGVYQKGTDNVPDVAETGTYVVVVNIEDETIEVNPAKVYGIGPVFGDDAWAGDIAFTVDNTAGTVYSPAFSADGELRMYGDAATLTDADGAAIDWWRKEFITIDGDIVYRGLGGDQARLNVTAGQVITLDFNAGTGTIQ